MWSEEKEAALLAAVGDARPVSQETAAAAAEALDVSTRSVGAKLRKMGVEVEKAGPRARKFSEDQEEALEAFLNEHAGSFTYAEIAEQFCDGEFSAKQVQGKILSMELTDAVKPTPKKEVQKTYSPEEEEKFIALANAGAFLEDIADALGKTLQSVRGKALSLNRTEVLSAIPAQRNKVVKVDPIDELGADLATMTVEQIAEATGKTPRGVRTIITRRGLACADYKAKKKTEAA